MVYHTLRMPSILQPVVPGAKPANQHGQTSEKPRLTATSVFLSFLLSATLVGLGERGLYDLNRFFNPFYQACNQARYLISGGESCPVEQHAVRQLLLHGYVSVPLFIIFLGLVLYLRQNRLATWQQALFRVSSAIAIVFGVQFLLEATLFLFRFYRTESWYFMLGIGAVLLMVLVVYTERRAARKKASGQAHH